MKLISTINKALDYCILALAGIGGVALGFLLLGICYATFSRFVFSRPLAFLMEYATYTLIYIAFLAGPWLLQQRRHVQVDIVLNGLRPRVRVIVTAVTNVLGAIVCAVICYYGAMVTTSSIQRNIRLMDSMATPQWILVIVIPIGMFFTSVQFLRLFADNIKEIREIETEKEG